MNRRRLLRLKRAGLLGTLGSTPRTAGAPRQVPPRLSISVPRGTGVFRSLSLAVAAAFLGVVLWAVVGQGSGNRSAPGQPRTTAIEPVTQVPSETRPAGVPADVPATPSRIAVGPRALATVDVDALTLRLTGRVAKGPASQASDVVYAVQSLGVVWPVLSPDERARAVQGVADAIVLRRDVPSQLRAVVAAMSTSMRDDVFAFLELGSDAAPLPAALLVNP